jgi:diguanylate cyclase (GGDEF)-like protein
MSLHGCCTWKKNLVESEGNGAAKQRLPIRPDKRRQYGEAMNTDNLEARLEGIQTLLSHLHGEITALEESYTQVAQLFRRLQGACEADDLTGLLRRQPFSEKWQSLLDECRRLNTDCGIIMLDIDHFKGINDAYGHPTGDEVLKRVASMLLQYQSPRCLVTRYGGEEFAVALQGTEKEIEGVAERIRRDAEGLRIQLSDGIELQCTLSAGVASALRAGYDAPRLLESADTALYQAKRAGRNRVKAAA